MSSSIVDLPALTPISHLPVAEENSVPIAPLLASPPQEVLVIGEFVVGDSEADGLSGHPGIRY